MYAQTPNPAAQYSNVGVASSIEDAKPAELVYMLFEGAISRLAAAKGHIERKEIARKGEMISKATAIIIELQRSLDMEKGGEFAERLDALYESWIANYTMSDVLVIETDNLDYINDFVHRLDVMERIEAMLPSHLKTL